MRKVKSLVLLIAAPLVLTQCFTEPEEHGTSSLGLHQSDHVYQAFTADGIGWDEANALAQDTYANTACGLVQGHLATITSLEEDEFVYDLWIATNTALEPGNFLNSEAWLGGLLDDSGNWSWVTGESWVYDNWDDGIDEDGNPECCEEPSGDGIVLAFAIQGKFDGWNDEGSTAGIYGYVVEFDCDDDDHDGVDNKDDLCPDTVAPESGPTRRLGTNRWTLGEDGTFVTTSPRGNGPGRSYSIYDTGGCSCEQIIAEQDLGEGHTKFGCRISAMDDWVSGGQAQDDSESND